MPLQSGCDKTLRRMARKTSQEIFRGLATAARASIPNLNLTTDIIAGFPGETDVEFEDSYNFVDEIGFSRLHVFPYSQRPGTAAATMPNQLPKTVKKERVGRMIALGKQHGLAFHKQFEGQTMNVLWEMVAGSDEHGTQWSGYTDNYIRVLGYGDGLLNMITQTELSNATSDGMNGRAIIAGNL